MVSLIPYDVAIGQISIAIRRQMAGFGAAKREVSGRRFCIGEDFGMKRMTIIVLQVAVSLAAWAQPPADKGLIPERILLTWTGDPARTQTVTWRTDTLTTGGAQIALALPSPDLAKQSKLVLAVTTSTETTAGITVAYHTAPFTGLEPATKYAYRVGNGDVWSEWNHFTTANDTPSPFSFIYVGDAQNDVKSLWSRVIREAFRRAPDVRFTLHAGDLINNANTDWQWGEWFEAAGWINRMIPCIAIPGNHEYFKPDRNTSITLSHLWTPQFEYPRNGVPGLEDTTYYLDYQGVRIVCLNSNEKWEQQAPWLEDTLSKNPHKWTILTFHHPVYSAAILRDNPKVRETWLPIIDKYKVDLVLQGHDHTYGRSKALTSGTVVGEGDSGTVYVVSISGPKMYDSTTASKHLMERIAEYTQFYQIVSINGDVLKYEALTPAGELYDQFELHKLATGGSQLINRIPSLAERRRKR